MSRVHKPGFLAFPAIAALSMVLLSGSVGANDIRLNLPKRTKPTPVQKLNRDGVKAIEKNDYAKARMLFYKAYLLDPNDPFTLNNLGYIAELEGEVDRAQRYYGLAAEQSSDALVAESTSDAAVGKPVEKIAGNTQEKGLQVNRMNVAAIGLLQKDRAAEADVILHRALELDAKNPFTLNNLGFTEEKEGEWEKALAFYTRAANTGSNEPVVVTLKREWRGKAISEVAAENADNLRKAMRKGEPLSSRVARLNLRGVSALNRNDPRQAKEYFEEAYKLDPSDAFTLNNMGYVAEMNGDRETANFYYEKAEAARRANARVDVASRNDAEGRRLGEVARQSGSDVDQQMQRELEAKRREGGAIVLRRRDNSVVQEPAKPASPPNESPAVTARPEQTMTPENAPTTIWPLPAASEQRPRDEQTTPR